MTCRMRTEQRVARPCTLLRHCAPHCGSRTLDKTVFYSLRYEPTPMHLFHLSLLIGRGPAALIRITCIAGTFWTREWNSSDEPRRQPNLPSNDKIKMCFILLLLLSYSASRIFSRPLNNSLAIPDARRCLVSRLSPLALAAARLSHTSTHLMSRRAHTHPVYVNDETRRAIR